MTTDSPPQDTGRRRRRPAERGSVAPQSRGQPQSPFSPVELVSRDELESIHQAALAVLKEIGIDFLHDEARTMLKDAGADVDPASRRVRFEPALVEAHIGLAPKEFRLHARNSARDLSIGGRHVAFGTVASAPNSFDRAGGDGALAIGATTRTSSASGRVSIRFISSPAIRSSRSTFPPRPVISTRCSTC
jgi:trimethylamine---corrinoid protein Co-methyltransferase